MLLEVIGDSTENVIIDFLIEGRLWDYTIRDISRACEVSRQTVHKVLPIMLKVGTVIETRKVGHIRLYTFNKENERVKWLLKLDTMLLKASFDEIENQKDFHAAKMKKHFLGIEKKYGTKEKAETKPKQKIPAKTKKAIAVKAALN